MSRRITYAKLHDGFFVPNIGAFKDTLPPDNRSLNDFIMTLEDNGSITLTWNAGGYKQSCMVGAANVKNAVFVPEKIQPTGVSESKST